MATITIEDFAPFMLREGVSRRKTFGAQSLLINGNVFLSFMPMGVVFKMDEAGMKDALAYAGADYFQPPMAGAPKMKNWVEVPFSAEADWLQLAESACDYVGALPPKPKKKK